jgi:hypothetical protein
MTITKVGESRNSGGVTGANKYASESYAGEINSKAFEVTVNSCAAPVWGGEDLDSLDQDDCAEILDAIAEISDL